MVKEQVVPKGKQNEHTSYDHLSKHCGNGGSHDAKFREKANTKDQDRIHKKVDNKPGGSSKKSGPAIADRSKKSGKGLV